MPWRSEYILGYHNPYPHVLEVEWIWDSGHQISILLAMTPATRQNAALGMVYLPMYLLLLRERIGVSSG